MYDIGINFHVQNNYAYNCNEGNSRYISWVLQKLENIGKLRQNF